MPAGAFSGQIVIQYLLPGDQGEEDDVVPPPDHEEFSCDVKPSTLAAGQSTLLAWNVPVSAEGISVSMDMETDDDDDDRQAGSVIIKDRSSLIYTAPASVPATTKVRIIARSKGTDHLPAFCEVTLEADDDIGVPDDGEIRGITGNVYRLERNTRRLPDFSTMDPVARVVISTPDIPERAFSRGFPGVPDLFEWFGIRFRTRLILPEDCDCEFKLVSDDGAILRIDGRVVVDNDGIHPTRAEQGAIWLGEGSHTLELDYYQGPRYHIALQLFWRPAGGTWQIIDPAYFERPLQ